MNARTTHATRKVTVISEIDPLDWMTPTGRAMRAERFWTEWVQTDGAWAFQRANLGGVLLDEQEEPTRTPAWDAWTLPPNTDSTRESLVTELPEQFADLAREHYREATK